MGHYGSLWVISCPYKSMRSLFVLIHPYVYSSVLVGPYWSFLVFISHYALLWVLMGPFFPHGCLEVFIRSSGSLCLLIGPDGC